MVDGLGHGAEKARCGLWCESGKMMGAQSGVQEHPDASPVLATHKLRRWCKHWTLLHCYLESETRRESLTGKFIHRRTLVLESKCRKRFLGRARWQPPAASRGAEGSEKRTGTSISTTWNPDGKGYGIVKGAGCVRVHRCVPTCSTHINGGRQWKSVKSRLWYKEALVLCCCCLVAHLGRILRDPVNCQVPLSMRFPRQEYWRGLPFPPPADLPNSGVEPMSLHWQVDYLPLSHRGSPWCLFAGAKTLCWRMVGQGSL